MIGRPIILGSTLLSLAIMPALAEQGISQRKTTLRIAAPVSQIPSSEIPISGLSATVDAAGRVVPAPAPDNGAAVQYINVEEKSDLESSPICPEAIVLRTDDAKAMIRRIAIEERFSPEFALAVARAESRYNSTAVSAKGAYGLMQIMPVLAKELGINFCNPEENVRGGIYQLRYLQDKYKNPIYILAAYNAGERAMLDANGLPPFRETLGFVAGIMNELNGWPSAQEAKNSADITGSIPPVTGAPKQVNILNPTPKNVISSTDQPRKSREASGWKSGFVMNFD